MGSSYLIDLCARMHFPLDCQTEGALVNKERHRGWISCEHKAVHSADVNGGVESMPLFRDSKQLSSTLESEAFDVSEREEQNNEKRSLLAGMRYELCIYINKLLQQWNVWRQKHVVNRVAEILLEPIKKSHVNQQGVDIENIWGLFRPEQW